MVDGRVMGKDEVVAALSRMLSGGPLERMPKRRSDTEMLLALAAAGLGPGLHTEQQINEYLTPWLAEFASPIGVDHVTFRRYMVDFNYVGRVASGRTYAVIRSKVDATLDAEAGTVDPGDVLATVTRQRRARKRTHGK
jgi:hypothetical protein